MNDKIDFDTNFDFDTMPDRRDAASSKWEKYGNRDIIPLWVADMDFRTAPCIIDTLSKRVQHGIFGYTQPPRELPGVITHALERDFDWRIDPDWLVWMPSLVVGLNVVSRAFANEGEEILTAVPIYPPFLSAPRNAGCVAVTAPLEQSDGRWVWDFDALEKSVTNKTRTLLLCSPHNPTGRVWTRDELQQLAAFCDRHDLVLVSDEIHSGLVLDRDKRHIPIASLGDVAGRTVTLLSASKTFNLPGLGCAFAIVSDERLRARIEKTMRGIVHHVGALGYFATMAAYRDGKPWQLALLDYLRGNRDLVETRIATMPGLRTWHVEATYLAWIDARALPVDNPVRFFEDAGIGLYDGTLFDAPGFLRLNFACPRSLLASALDRMQHAVAAL
ncbi:MAG: aspartate aminotransferase [Betaproteobacteria bacterium SG8_40]|nr:MAG: aspartate aminotransferase [Betaproteobacteria bacterium SG8_40]